MFLVVFLQLRLLIVPCQLDKTLHYKHNESRTEHKAQNVDAEEYGVGHHVMYNGEHGKCAVKVGTDEEHVECIIHTVINEVNVDYDIHYHRTACKGREDRRTLQQILEVHFLSVSERQIYTPEHLYTVMVHSLCIYELIMHKHIVGEYIYTYSGKHREGGNKGYRCVTKLAVLGKRNYGKYV